MMMVSHFISPLSFFRFFTHMEEEQKRVEIVEKTNVEWKLVGKHKFSEEKKNNVRNVTEE